MNFRCVLLTSASGPTVKRQGGGNFASVFLCMCGGFVIFLLEKDTLSVLKVPKQRQECANKRLARCLSPPEVDEPGKLERNFEYFTTCAMAQAESRQILRTDGGIDDVEKSLELLDKVLSEFEEPESLPPPVEPESPSQGHQSEDDGYMSMNGRRAKFSPGFQPTDEGLPHGTNSNNERPPPPEEAERIISDILPRISPTTSPLSNQTKEQLDGIFARMRKIEKTPTDTEIGEKAATTRIESGNHAQQTTLPKARPVTVAASRYGSLPNSSPPREFGASRTKDQAAEAFADMCGDGKTILGIGISAVHDAVLRGVGVGKIPASRNASSSVERHRDIRKNSSHLEYDQQDSATSASSASSDESNHLSPPMAIISNSPSAQQLLQQQELLSKSPPSSIIMQKNINNLNRIKVRHGHHKNNSINFDGTVGTATRTSDSDDFSDDSLEETSLPPPPPPPVVPPPPTLSAPVTPSKRGSIAWEINLDDSVSGTDEPPKVAQSHESINAKFSGRRPKRSTSGSQSSLASTPGHSGTSNKRTGSAEWPDPPEAPICSTEDEAASIYSDSDEVIPYPTSFLGQGTYVIRKGRKQRQRVPNMEAVSSVNTSRYGREGGGSIELPSPVFPVSMLIPNSRHSIDLGSPPPPPPPIMNSLCSPRSRLSLDLSSPTSELPASASVTNNSTVISPRYSEFKTYSSTFDGLQALDASNSGQAASTGYSNGYSLTRVASLPAITPPHSGGENLSTPRRELAPPIEEDEEQDSESQRGAPLRQIENNISALLRGDIPVARVADIPMIRRPLGFRPGVHKSESAKEMLLSQSVFGPLPPSPPSSSPEMESDGFPPLPPSPRHAESKDEYLDMKRTPRLPPKHDSYYQEDEEQPPAVPPHRGPSLNTLKTRSMDAGFSKSYRNGTFAPTSPHGPGTLPSELAGGVGGCGGNGIGSRRRFMSGAFPKRLSGQSPREERRLQTSCSLPETPIFARGCDIPRTPHRRAPELPNSGTGSRTAPRSGNNSAHSASMNASIVGIGNPVSSRQRNINHVLASGEMLRLAGGPARGWYPKQRHRPASTENLDRLHQQAQGFRAWDAGTSSRKPLTLPPNLTPKFFNKSPREALRRVTSLLIRKGNNSKEAKRDSQRERDLHLTQSHYNPSGALAEEAPKNPTTQKKKGFFKSFWKKSKHYSLEQ
ncbi:uncharacterized protein LOC132263461 isoform X2 [Phlebotomus argentipes]|uniref:uncharacterized protein LOC132263461 isoform X2 n=1 Tax=Phlebotomus argentipes TaxID=94469 RepID=UPI0028930D1E|nr:uncharacterized protein LOC132263461 isoform X2 [Phlebotomus argentipes]